LSEAYRVVMPTPAIPPQPSSVMVTSPHHLMETHVIHSYGSSRLRLWSVFCTASNFKLFWFFRCLRVLLILWTWRYSF